MVPYKDLWQSYFKKDHRNFLSTLINSTGLKDESFGKLFIPDLKKAILQEFIKKISKAYRTLSLKYLSEELALKQDQVCHILTEMINKKLINGLIDDIDGIFDNHDFLVNEGKRDQIN